MVQLPRTLPSPDRRGRRSVHRKMTWPGPHPHGDILSATQRLRPQQAGAPRLPRVKRMASIVAVCAVWAALPFDRSRPCRLGGPARTVWPPTPTDRPPESGLDVRTVGAPRACRRRPAHGPCGSNRPHAPASHPSQTPPSRASLHVSSTTPELYDPRQGPQPLENSASSSEKRAGQTSPAARRRPDVCERL